MTAEERNLTVTNPTNNEPASFLDGYVDKQQLAKQLDVSDRTVDRYTDQVGEERGTHQLDRDLESARSAPSSAWRSSFASIPSKNFVK